MTMLATDRPGATAPAAARARRLTLTRSALITAIFITPAVVVRIAGLHPDPVVALLIFGAAVVAASFLLAWAAEAAQIDVSGGLTIAVLALVAVLPEYAVDLSYAYVSGHNADYTQYAAANMTGSNRLLMGLGWPVVVLVSILVARKTGADSRAGLALEPANRVELGFLLIAGVVAFVIPASGEIHLALGLVLLAWFGYYLYKVSHGDVEEPNLIGTAAALAELPDRGRRMAVVGMLLVSGAVILLCAKPFADNLVAAGTELGIDEFLLVQWLSPLASESPGFIIAGIFSCPGKGPAGGGALILALRFRGTAALALLVLFIVQFPIVTTQGRLVLCGIYTLVAIAGLIINHRYVIATVRAPFVGRAIRHSGRPQLTEDGPV